MDVSPKKLKLAEGESASFEVTLTYNGTAPFDVWSHGSLTWKAGKTNVYTPISARPVQFSAPAGLHGVGTSGATEFDVSFGYTGDYAADVHGLVAPMTEDENVVDDPANDINVALGTGVGVTFHFVDIAPGTDYARFSLFDDSTDGDDDLDLYVFGPGGLVGASGSATSEEVVNLEAPAPGLYTVVVHGWETDGPDANYTLFSWLVGVDEGNMTASAPSAAVVGDVGHISVSWSGLAVDTSYLGVVTHRRNMKTLGRTTIAVDTN